MQMNPKEQGPNAETIFHGEAASEAAYLIYKESPALFSELIRNNVEPGTYSLTDLGSHKGEFLQDLVGLLPEYSFKTVAVDINQSSLESNNADYRVASNLSRLALADKSTDITIARYALAWNSIEDQKTILSEIKRVTRRIAIIQHQGANSTSPQGLQTASKKLFSGTIPELKRADFFFSTIEDIEGFMKDLEISFERIQNRDVAGLSNIFIEKYHLSEEEAVKVREILQGNDYINQSAWILKF